MIPEIWDDLAALLNQSPGEWVLSTAWAVGGGDPDGCSIRLAGGVTGRSSRFHSRAIYEAAWCVCTKKSERVRLARLDAMPDGQLREVVRWLKPEDRVWVKRDKAVSGQGM